MTKEPQTTLTNEEYRLIQDTANATASFVTRCQSCGVSVGANHAKECSYFREAKKLIVRE